MMMGGLFNNFRGNTNHGDTGCRVSPPMLNRLPKLNGNMINNRGKTHRRATARRGSTMFIIFMIICSFAFTTNTPPVVSNVSFAQRTDGSGIVDVYYDVDDADGDSLKISIAVISNVSDTSNLFNIDSLVSGDVGRGIYSGTGKHIIWQYGTGNPNTYSNEVIIKITADDTQAATTIADYDGNSYATVQIGNQLWMAENLKTTHYNNGDEIQYVQDESSEPNVWENLSTGAYGYYEDNPSYKETYGNLYNWYAVDDERGVCPEGYHVPTDDEYKVLEMYLGMSESEANDTGSRGTNEGSKLAGGADLWYSGILKNNSEFGSSGFTGLPAGYRGYDNGTYSATMGWSGSFWSSSESSSGNAWSRELNYYNSNVIRYSTNKRGGFSVRCLGD
ncbi:MAG: fibrobacter succinogenes major paralogous domain-containing protein [Candidatus Marinimicrobia bacterium]|nr:fibrobacter succinogenes major paralogous domain-containing protein [Candidatus Neomarinimicrobiota bacterium]